MPYRFKGSDDVNGKLIGPVYWFRILAFQPGDTVQFEGGVLLPITDLAMYISTSGWKFLNITQTTAIEYSNNKCETPPSTSGSILVSSTVVKDPLPTIVAVGSTSGTPGNDLNSSDWGALNTRYSTWIDVRKYIRHILSASFVNFTNGPTINVQWNKDNTLLPGNDQTDADTGAISGNQVVIPNMLSANEFRTYGNFARLKISSANLAGPSTLRVSWWGIAG